MSSRLSARFTLKHGHIALSIDQGRSELGACTRGDLIVGTDGCHIGAFLHSRIHENDVDSSFGSLVEDVSQSLRIHRRNNEGPKFSAGNQRFDNIDLILNGSMISRGE